MHTKAMRALALAGVLLMGYWGAARLGRAAVDASTAAEFYVLDAWAEQVLGLQLPERALTMRGPAGDVALGPQALSARFLPSGEVVYIDDDLALWRLNPATGASVELLPSGSANAPLFVSPGGRSLAYLKPRDIATREEVLFPLSNGIAVLHLDTGTEQVLLDVPEVTVNLYGWAGDRLIVQIPTWDPVTLALPKSLQLAALAVTDLPQPPVPLADLPAFAANTRYPQTSLDQRFLAYETPGGVVVAALTSTDARYQVYNGLSEPQWTDAGLTVLDSGAKAPFLWSETDLDQTAPVPGVLAWPPAADLAGPAATDQANAVLFYRPVSASTRVSAYMDLNTAYGAIRDWTGWVGGGWVYGHAYDGHRGTDYDGVTGNPVTAAAPGTVDRVVIYCCNTYNGGPASFGTYVRLYHGLLADGLYYWTLVGHLLPDGVQVQEGEYVSGLPRTLGLMGNTGWSTGDHTHLQVYRSQGSSFSGTYSIDPYEWGIISDTPPVLPQPTATPQPTTGDISGIVRDWQGQPAPGAEVKVQVAGKIYVVTTGPTGAYAFAGLPPGSTTLRAVKGARWGSGTGSVQAGQVLGGDIALSQCVGQAVAADACPALLHDQAVFVTDMTYDDGTVVGSGQVLTKTWRLRNTGTTTWGSGYHMVFVSGNKEINTPATVNVPATAVNATVDLSVKMTAAGATGTHRGYWRLRNAQGVFFGPTFWVELNTQPSGQAATASAAQAWDETPERNGLAAAPSSADAAMCTVSAPATSSDTTFNVSWSASGGAAIVSYDVQFLDSSRGAWRDWVRGYPAGQQSAPFTGQIGHAYGFRCRATDSAPSTGIYPGVADATTLVGSVAGQPDLRLTSLQARPAPGGGLLATVVVENAGSAGTPPGFSVDLYRNDPPSGPDDFAFIVNTWWVSEALGAGSSVTLNFALTEPSGNASLYAQVDTGNLVPEADESNNLYATAVSGCVILEDAYEYDDVIGAAQPLSVGASQARNLGGPSEHDWVSLSLVPGRLYRLETSALGPGVDTRLTVYNAAGTQRLAFNDDQSATSLAARLLFAPRGGATSYRLLVDNWNPATGGCGATYTLALTDLGKAYWFFFPVLARNQPLSSTLP